MSSTFSDTIKQNFLSAGTLQRLLLINIIFFLAIGLSKAISVLFMLPVDIHSFTSRWLAVPSLISLLLFKPWTLITYMFVHEDFFHLLFNMLWLYWMGKIFLEYLGAKKLLSTYILGGIAGAVVYIISQNVFPLFRNSELHLPMIGASASVLAITVAIATMVPDYKVFVFIIGPVSLKYLAGAIVVLDILSMGSPDNVAHFAHLGGAAYGFFYITQLKNGRDIAGWFNSLIDKLTSSVKASPKMKVHYGRGIKDEDFIMKKKSNQKRLDDILDKISKSGYGSLTAEEKEFLFKTSKEE